MSQAITLVNIKNAGIPAGTIVELMGDMYHDPETGRLRILYNNRPHLVPESAIKRDTES